MLAARFERQGHLAAIQPAEGKDHQGHGLAVRRRMRMAVDPGQGLRPADEAERTSHPLLDQRDVQLSGLEGAPDLMAHAAGHLQPQARVRVGKGRQHGRERVRREILGHSQPDASQARVAAELLFRLPHEADDALRIPKQPLPFGRRGDVPPATVEQLAAELGLQPSDLLADRRLGKMHAHGGPREASGFHHRQEATQEIGIEHRSSYSNSHWKTSYHLISLSTCSPVYCSVTSPLEALADETTVHSARRARPLGRRMAESQSHVPA
ncbi:hypothetical protein D3C72_1415010 [compost metagenome]